MPLYTNIKGPINYTVAGNPTIENGIVTNLSTMYNYLILPHINFINNDIDYVLKYSYSENATNYRNVLLGQFGSTQCQLYISYDGDLIGFYMNGVQVTLSNIRIENYTYFRFLKKGTNLTLALSNDGINWDKSITHTSINWKNFQGDTHLGESANVSEPNRPNFITLDLNESYINVNNTSWFGTSFGRVKINSGLARYTVVGNPTIVDGILSNLSSNNYLQLGPSSITYNSMSDVEFYCRYKFDENLEKAAVLIGHSGDRIMAVGYTSTSDFYYPTGTPNNTVSGSSIEFYSHHMQPNTWYRQCLKGKNGVWTTILYDDNGNELGRANKELTFDNITRTILIGKPASWLTGIVSNIDLNNSYIKLNGGYFWRGSDYYQKLDSYKVRQDKFSKYYTIVDGKLTWANPNIYLKSTGTQYINTEFLPSNDIEFDVKYLTNNSFNASTYGCIFGSRVSSGNNDLQVTTYAGGSTGTFRFGVNTTDQQYVAGITRNKIVKSSFHNLNYCTDIVNYSVNNYNFSDSKAIYLFGLNQNNIMIQSGTGCQIYFAKFNNSLQKKHFVPVPKGLLIGNFVVPSNGMWDIVTQTFYGNSGTGEFEIGGIPDDYIIEGGKLIWCNPNISLENNSNWSAYINTGIIPTDDMRFQTLSEVTDSASHDGCLLGCRTGSTASGKQFVLWYGNYSSTVNSGSLVYGGSAAGKCNFNLGTLQKTQLDYDGTYFYCNGTQITPNIANVNKENYSTTLSIYLYGFRTNASGSIESRRFHGKVYEVALWSGSTILQYLVPVPKGILIGDKIAPSNCMFDLVTQTFLENQGTGEFTIGGLSGDYVFVGEDVVWCNPSIYLESTGTQYIDTQYYLKSNNLGVNTKLLYNFNNTADKCFIGNQDNSTNRFAIGFYSKYVYAYSRDNSGKDNNVITSTFSGENKLLLQIEYNKNSITKSINSNGTITTNTYNKNIYPSNNTIQLFNCGDSSNYIPNVKMYFCVIKDNGNLVRYFVPVTTNMQISGTTIPAPGMLDMVTNKFFGNQGTGSFTYGKDE